MNNLIKLFLYLLIISLGIGNYAMAGSAPVSGFADISFKDTNETTAVGNSAFTVGQIDFYYTARLDEKTSFLAEIVYEFAEDASDSEADAAVLDPERILVSYFVNPWLKFSAGRFHTALGYWNDNFHHGSWLQTTVSRPKIYRFEDDGGMLPVHMVGLEFRGEGSFGNGLLGYVANVGNGRGPKVDPPQMIRDHNESKAANLVLYYSLPDLDNMRFGLTYYTDGMPGSVGGGSTQAYSYGQETITGAHFVWQPAGFELMTEYIMLKHTYDSSKPNTDLSGYYAQLSYNMDKLTPYVRIDNVKAATSTDAYTGISENFSGLTGGIRYDLSRRSALKFEYFNDDNQTSADVSGYFVNWSFGW